MKWQKFSGMVASQKVGLSMFPMGPTLKMNFLKSKFHQGALAGKIPDDLWRKTHLLAADPILLISTFFENF